MHRTRRSSACTAGNARFVAGTLTHQNGVTERRLALTGHQAPFAAILACSDSRVAPELLFDQNVGDIFVFRNAGNFVDPAVLGTMEYGFSVLGVKLIVVVGHTSCGAVNATYDAVDERQAAPTESRRASRTASAPGLRPS